MDLETDSPKKILFLMFAFPDMNKSFNMYTSMVKQFKKGGHEIAVIAPASKGDATQIKMEGGVEVLRVKTLPIKNVPNYVKGLSNLLLPFQFKNAFRKHYGRNQFDWVILPTPPITLVSLAQYVKRCMGSKVYLILRDIFPQNAIDLGFMKKEGFLHRYFRNKEKQLYGVSDLIGCMSEGNRDYVVNHNPEVDPAKLRILENWQDPYVPVEIDKLGLKEKFGLKNKFTVVFGGNMGKPQQLENVLELADRCGVYEDVQFLLLGSGVAMDRLSKEIEAKKIGNIRTQGTIPKVEYQQLLGLCQIGLISLHKDFTIPNIPSKTLDYFNVGLPVLASVDAATDYSHMLEKSGGGLCSLAGDHDTFYANFQRLYSDEEMRERLAMAGKNYYQQHMRSDHAYQHLITQLNTF